MVDEKPPAVPAKGGAATWAQRDVRIRYSILQNPSWPECLVLGFQVRQHASFSKPARYTQLCTAVIAQYGQLMAC